MRSNSAAVVMLILLLVTGAAVGGWWLMTELGKEPPAPTIRAPEPAAIPAALPGEPGRTPAPPGLVVDDAQEPEAPQAETPPEDATRAPRETLEREPRRQAPGVVADPRGNVSEDGTARSEGPDPRPSTADDVAGKDPPKPDAEQAAPPVMIDYKVTIAGRVLYEGGYGIEGAEIRTSHIAVTTLDGGRHTGQSVELAEPGQQPVATTDAGGNYEAEITLRVPEGTSYVDVTVTARVRGFVPGDVARAAGLRQDSYTGNIDVTMSAAGALTGRVVDGSLQALAEVSVYATREGPRSGNVGIGGGLTSRATTDARGEYRFDSLVPGEWRVTASSGSYAIDGELPLVNITAGTETRARDIMMRPTASARVQVLKDDGTPIGRGAERPVQVTIRLKLRDGSAASSSATADADGYVTYRRLPITAEEFTIRVSGYQESAPMVVNLNATRENDLGTVRLTPQGG